MSDGETLAELLFHAERFCSEIQRFSLDIADPSDQREFHVKLGQCKNLQTRLQNAFNEDKLNLSDAEVRGEFRQMVIAALWITFYTRRLIDRRLYRMVVNVEAGFTFLLTQRIGV